MLVRDWHDVDDTTVAGLFAAEKVRWREQLSWDTTAMWPVVEAGRRAGTVAGAIAYDEAGVPDGWCFALLQDDTLQVGGFLARTPQMTSVLLDGLARSTDGQAARRWIWFGYFDAPGLPEAIAARGGTSARYVYLRCRLVRQEGRTASPGSGEAPRLVRAWRASDAVAVPALLASAYASHDASRPFAPTGQMDEWQKYTAILVGSDGCGVFDPGLSLVADALGGGLDAAAVVTRITPATAHLAQLAVRADAQAAGIGRALLTAAQARAGAAGCTELTLLVHEHNAHARRLYRRAGFVEDASFLSAGWDVRQPRTSSSDALATGGVKTRR